MVQEVIKTLRIKIDDVHHISQHWEIYAEYLKKKIRNGDIVVLNRKRIFQIWLDEFLIVWIKDRGLPTRLYENYKNLIIEKDVNRQLNYVVSILIRDGYIERVRKGKYRNLWIEQNNEFYTKIREVCVKDANP